MEYIIEHMKGVLVFWQIVLYIIMFVMICVTLNYTNTEHLDIEEFVKKHKFLLITTIISIVIGVTLTTIYLFLYV